MINNSDFSERLRTIMSFYQLSASAFADKIQVPRSSISHLLSGRNKPSLDFVMKVVKEFHEVELYWLLNGKGTFPKNLNPTLASSSDDADHKVIAQSPEASHATIVSGKKIERIVIFFEDGTFKEYIK